MHPDLCWSDPIFQKYLVDANGFVQWVRVYYLMIYKINFNEADAILAASYSCS